MKRVWKTRIEPNSIKDDVYRISVPSKAGAIPRFIAIQEGDICIWHEIDEEADDGSLSIICVGTGFGRVPDDCPYIGSVIHLGFVWHFYWEKAK